MRKKKILTKILTVLILVTMLSPVGVALAIDYEDFTTYSEYDEDSKITVTSSTITCTSATAHYTDSYYVRTASDIPDMSENWTINFTFHVTSTNNNMHQLFGSFWNTTSWPRGEPVYNGSQTGSGFGIDHYLNAGTVCTRLYYFSGSATYSSWNVYTRTSGERYYTYHYDAGTGTYGTLYLYQYTDEDRTILEDSTSLALGFDPAGTDDYYYAASSCDHPTSTALQSWYFEDMYYATAEGQIVNNSAVYDSWDYYTDTYYYELEAEVTEDLDDDWLVTFYFKEDGDPSYDSWLSPEYPINDSDPIVHSWWAVEDGVTYWWYAEMSNGGETYSSTPESFVADVEHTPLFTISALYTPYYNGDNSSALISGSILSDGGSNVTAWAQWSENTTDWTTSAVSETNLQTDDEFSINCTNLLEATNYYYRFKGTNDEGTDYSEIFTLVVANWTDPEVSGTYFAVTDTTASIQGTLDSDGGEDTIYVNFDYRVWTVGDTNDWITPYYGTWLEEDESEIWGLTGLLPNTHYEFRVKAFGQCYMQGFCDGVVYTDEISFWTSGYDGSPTIHLDEVGYYDDYTVYTEATVTNDGGLSCSAGMEYSYNEVVWYDCSPDQIEEGLEEDDEYTAYVSPGKPDENVVYRAWVCNYNGCTYSNKIWYKIEQGSSPSDDTDTSPSSDSDPLDWLARVVLGAIGMNNEGGKVLFVIVCMMILFGIFYKSQFFRIFMPVLCFTAFLVFGWIPVGIMVVILLGAGLGAWYVFKKAV